MSKKDEDNSSSGYGDNNEVEDDEKKPRRRSNRLKRKRDDDDEEDEDGNVIKKRKTDNSDDNEEKENPFKYTVYDDDSSMIVLDTEELPPSNKIAAFDLDDTIITPKSKKAFAINRNDWTFWDTSVPAKLKELKENGFKIVVFTNQNGITKGKVKKGDFIWKIFDICKELGFPMQVFALLQNDHYRKPSTEIFRYFVEEFNDNIEPDLSVSFYVGDAAGRPENVSRSKKKDHSCTDRKFAKNCGLKFHTPENFFLKLEETTNFNWGFDPLAYLEEINAKPKTNLDNIVSDKQEMVILVGSPASGKSSFSKKYFIPNGYVHINRDTLKTAAKCTSMTKSSLKEGKSVVIDNTNPTVENRKSYITIANSMKVPVRCFYFNLPRDLSKHLNQVRNRYLKGEVKLIPDIAYNKYYKGFVEPSPEEGFTEVREINFVPDFTDKELETIFKQYSDK